MRINVVCEERNNNSDFQWILRRSAEELQTIDNLLLNSKEPCELNYFLNYAQYKPLGGIGIGHFTHLEQEENLNKLFKTVALNCKYATCTCEITKDMLSKFIPEYNIRKIPYGCDERLHKRITFGVVGRIYPSGRKGEYLVANMKDAGFDVIAWGYGWESVGVRYVTNSWKLLPKFYKAIDYLIVTSLNEGGPVPVIDAIKAGVPVIAPNVGWCWEFPVIKYEKGNWDSLFKVLEKLCNPPTWKGWTQQHKAFFDFIKSENNYE